jgi:methyl-accepting chemotaxis protein
MAMDISNFKGKSTLLLSLSVPIKLGNEFMGVVCYDYNGDFMQNEALKIKESLFEGACEVSIVTEDGTFAANSINDTIIMKNIRNYYPKSSGLINQFEKEATHDFFTENDTLYLSTPLKFSNYDKEWLINIGIPVSVVMKEVNSQLAIQLIVGALLILLSIIMIIYFIGRLIKPLIDLTKATVTLSEGNLQLDVENSQNDEIGQLSDAFKMMIEKLREIVNGIHQGSTQIVSGSLQVSTSAQTISEGANKQAASTEEVASSIEEVITAINQNAENAQQAKIIAKKAETGIIESQKASLTTIEAMKKITEKTSIITEIAKQTNILAINAAIEAARAGALGKGFGIVAAEVRNLAESSNNAAADIVELAEESLRMSESSGLILTSIVPDVQKTTQLVEEIASASLEQNSGVKQISKAIEQLNSVTIQNSVTSEELASSSEELVAQSESLKQAISFFTVDAIKLEDKPLPDKIKIIPSQKVEPTMKETFITEKNEPLKKHDTKGFNLNLESKIDEEFEKY